MPTRKSPAANARTNSHLLSLDELVNDLSVKRVDLGRGHVFMRPLPAGAVSDFLSEGSVRVNDDGTVQLTDPKKQNDAMLRLIASAVCNGEGRLIFNRDDLDTLHKLPMKDYLILQREVTSAIGEGSEEGKDSGAVPSSATANGSDPSTTTTAASSTA